MYIYLCICIQIYMYTCSHVAFSSRNFLSSAVKLCKIHDCIYRITYRKSFSLPKQSFNRISFIWYILLYAPCDLRGRDNAIYAICAKFSYTCLFRSKPSIAQVAYIYYIFLILQRKFVYILKKISFIFIYPGYPQFCCFL